MVISFIVVISFIAIISFVVVVSFVVVASIVVVSIAPKTKKPAAAGPGRVSKDSRCWSLYLRVHAPPPGLTAQQQQQPARRADITSVRLNRLPRRIKPPTLLFVERRLSTRRASRASGWV
ncbi:MAG: hypothetical protein IT384_14615 [Deltaproteobacteria bacterium]|nr:hypothetical protein [Deltaproteobacteria bacterium]